MQRLLIITTKEDHSESLLTNEKLQIDIEYYGQELLSRVDELVGYDFVYFRDPFNTEKYNLALIEEIIDAIHENNPDVYYLDKANTLEDMLIEDKWRQAELFGLLMPHTQLVDDFSEINFDKQFVKKRISSRARGVIFSTNDLNDLPKSSDYISQEKLDIAEEYRAIAVKGALLDEAVVKSAKTNTQKVKVTDKICLTDEIRTFAASTVAKTPELDLIGIDIAKMKDGSLRLIEINRSPQFASFTKFTNKNPFEILFGKLLAD